jgi:2-oxoglutarate ferredoxin oxidoreductase subunit gamma
MSRLEVRICGLGGQGVITFGFILGQACIYEGKNAALTQTYGPETRGSVTSCGIVISNEEIDYPSIIKPDILVVMSQEAYDKYGEDLKKNGVIIVDSGLVDPKNVDQNLKEYKIAVTETAETILGNKLIANVVMLGVLTEITKIVGPNSVKKSIVKRWPKKNRLNIKAFQIGMKLGKVSIKKLID